MRRTRAKDRESPEMLSGARGAVNNWKRWKYVMWWHRAEIEGKFLVVTHHRESELVYLSNHQVIRDRLKRVDPNNRSWDDLENSCSLVGWRRGFQIRPLTAKGKCTVAWKVWWTAQQKLADYLILDEMHLGQLEYEELWEYVEGVLRYRLRTNGEVPTEDVIRWLDEHECGELEDRNGRGACPSTESILRALKGLSYELE